MKTSLSVISPFKKKPMSCLSTAIRPYRTLSAKEGSSVFDLIKLDLTGLGSSAGSTVVGSMKKAAVPIQHFCDFEGRTGTRLSLKRPREAPRFFQLFRVTSWF